MNAPISMSIPCKRTSDGNLYSVRPSLYFPIAAGWLSKVGMMQIRFVDGAANKPMTFMGLLAAPCDLTQTSTNKIERF
jgi:hypothetical protein